MQRSVTFSISQHSAIHQPDCGLNQPQQMTKPVWECEAGLVIKPTTLKKKKKLLMLHKILSPQNFTQFSYTRLPQYKLLLKSSFPPLFENLISYFPCCCLLESCRSNLAGFWWCATPSHTVTDMWRAGKKLGKLQQSFLQCWTIHGLNRPSETNYHRYWSHRFPAEWALPPQDIMR